MDFYTIVSIITIVFLIILLSLYGVYYNTMMIKPFPETQDMCPKLWTTDSSGNCINQNLADTSFNRLTSFPSNTPGLVSDGFNPNDLKWEAYDGAKNAICGKQKWANTNNISWNGISNYNSC